MITITNVHIALEHSKDKGREGTTCMGDGEHAKESDDGTLCPSQHVCPPEPAITPGQIDKDTGR
eukprot:780750-Pyramimonas_sp.AAC.2